MGSGAYTEGGERRGSRVVVTANSIVLFSHPSRDFPGSDGVYDPKAAPSGMGDRDAIRILRRRWRRARIPESIPRQSAREIPERFRDDVDLPREYFSASSGAFVGSRAPLFLLSFAFLSSKKSTWRP